MRTALSAGAHTNASSRGGGARERGQCASPDRLTQLGDTFSGVGAVTTTIEAAKLVTGQTAMRRRGANKSRQKGELLGAGSSQRRHTLVIAASSCPSGPPRERLLRRGRGSWLPDCEYGSGCGAYIVSRSAETKANTHYAAHLSEVTELPLSTSNSLIIASEV